MLLTPLIFLRKNRMKKNIIFIFSLFLYLLLSFSITIGEDNIWKEFIWQPNETNYRRCQQQIKDSLNGQKHGKYNEFKSPTYLQLMENCNFGKVLDLIENGNNYASHLGFQFYPLFYGHGEAHESINIALGKLIKKDSLLFLMLLNRYKSNIPEFGVRGIIGNFGDKFVDNMDDSIKEINERIKALQEVKEEDLKEIKIESIELLMEFRRSLKDSKREIEFEKVDPEDIEIKDP